MQHNVRLGATAAATPQKVYRGFKTTEPAGTVSSAAAVPSRCPLCVMRNEVLLLNSYV